MVSPIYQTIASSSRSSSDSSINELGYDRNKNEPNCKLDTHSSVSSEVSIYLFMCLNLKMSCNPCHPTCILLVSRSMRPQRYLALIEMLPLQNKGKWYIMGRAKKVRHWVAIKGQTNSKTFVIHVIYFKVSPFHLAAMK